MTISTQTYPSHRIHTPHREGRLIVTPSGVAGRFDSHAVDCPFVFTVDGRRGMTYVGWDGDGYQTALAWQQPDGSWHHEAIILARDPHHPHRRFNAALTSIVRDNDLWSSGELLRIDGWYYGTYHAYPAQGYEAGPGMIGIVRSRDLLSWEDFGTTLHAEDGAPWERGGLYKSWLMLVDGVFHLFYNAKEVDDFGSIAVPPAWIEQTGLATSTDLRTWTRVGTQPVLPVGGAGAFDERFASDPCVLRDADHWVMFYFGLAGDGHAREGYATSRDLVTWTKSADLLLDVGTPGEIDAQHAHKPAVVYWDGRLEHYYCAVSLPGAPYTLERAARGISRATSA
ncbi:hypothetical protein [Microbacterium invictum]|uniref:GH43/DUF377 family glycosyl hydrolase n=1 Tax=Microbacterium invictum TaxID=515415 RepID=A0AA40SRH8_9MICO|nr:MULTISPECIES: hypothetical protein [Microbacterium]MBB4141081.1 putative GH43/DUF377 family glycosyl hydrolase [Microbacterium invictum]